MNLEVNLDKKKDMTMVKDSNSYKGILDMQIYCTFSGWVIVVCEFGYL